MHRLQRYNIIKRRDYKDTNNCFSSLLTQNNCSEAHSLLDLQTFIKFITSFEN